MEEYLLTPQEIRWIELMRTHEIGKPSEMKVRLIAILSTLPEYGEIKIIRQQGQTKGFYVSRQESIVLSEKV